MQVTANAALCKRMTCFPLAQNQGCCHHANHAPAHSPRGLMTAAAKPPCQSSSPGVLSQSQFTILTSAKWYHSVLCAERTMSVLASACQLIPTGRQGPGWRSRMLDLLTNSCPMEPFPSARRVHVLLRCLGQISASSCSLACSANPDH